MTQPNLFDQIQRGPNPYLVLEQFIADLKRQAENWSETRCKKFWGEATRLFAELDRAVLTGDHETMQTCMEQINSLAGRSLLDLSA